jgi:hypothetical protein
MGRMTSMRNLTLALAAIGCGAFAPAAARAATFYVDGAQAGTTHPCTSPIAACKTIGAAIVDARGTTGGDTIQIAAGTYGEVVTLDQVSDAGDSLIGAGQDSDPATNTIIAAPGTVSSVLLGGGTASGVSLNDLEVHVASSAKTEPVVQVDPGVGGHAELTRVTVAVTNAGHHEPAITVLPGAVTLSYDDVASAGTGPAIVAGGASPGTLNLDRSDISGGAASGLFATTVVLGDAETTRITHSLLSAPGGAGTALSSTAARLTVDSSIILGGSVFGVLLQGAPSARTLLRHVTIDAGATGGTDPAVSVTSQTAEVANSILLGGVNANGGGTLTCLYSELLLNESAGVACGGPEANQQHAPDTLFASLAPGTDYRLKPGSPAVDAGVPGPLPADEATTDFDGNPRLLDGNLDCTARTDMGAYELSGLAGSKPQVSISAPASAGTNHPVLFTSTVNPGAPAPLHYLWGFPSGASPTTASTTQTFTAVGQKLVTLTVTDAYGCAATATGNIKIFASIGKTAPPTITNVKVILKGHRKLLSAFRYTLSEKAKVSIKWQRAKRGRVSLDGKSCEFANSSNNHRKSCTKLFGRVFSIGTISGSKGTNREAVSHGTLAHMVHDKDFGGTYQVRLQATDSAGIKSPLHTVTFKQ